MGFSEWRLKTSGEGCRGCRGYPIWIWDPMGYIDAMEYPRTNGFSRRDGDGLVPPIQLAVCNTSQRSGMRGPEPLMCFLFWRLS